MLKYKWKIYPGYMIRIVLLIVVVWMTTACEEARARKLEEAKRTTFSTSVTETQQETVTAEKTNVPTTGPATTVSPTGYTTKETTKETDTTKEVAESRTTPVGTTEKKTSAKETTKKKKEPETTTIGHYEGKITIYEPAADGSIVYTGNGTTIDASNSSQGYCMVKHKGKNASVIVQIMKEGETYTYDLTKNNKYEVFPLQMGNGTYTIRTLEQIKGDSYAVIFSQDISVKIQQKNQPYLYPVQIIPYSKDSNAVQLSYDLCIGKSSDKEKAEAIYQYICANIKYDYDKAASVQVGYISDPDRTLSEKKGICLDYAVLLATMLRAQNIPTQVIYGSSDQASWHGWNQVYYKGKWHLYDATFGASGVKGTNYVESQHY